MDVTYRTDGPLTVTRHSATADYADAGSETMELAARLDARRGVLLSSGVEFPGRYTRWDIGFVDPPVMVEARGLAFTITALNDRGRLLLPAIARAIDRPPIELAIAGDDLVAGCVLPSSEPFSEERRSRQPSIFSLLRAISALFASDQDEHLGLYGAFGYDLVFQFESVAPVLERQSDHRDLVLFLPDEILTVDHARHTAVHHRYEFEAGGRSTAGLPRDTAPAPCRTQPPPSEVSRGSAESDYAEGEYAQVVVEAKRSFARGDLFEVVLGQTFAEPCAEIPSVLFARLRHDNPAPYAALMNLGQGRISGVGFARDVRACGRPQSRDLPDQRHHRARARCPGRCRPDSRTAEFGQGRSRTHNVHGRGPE